MRPDAWVWSDTFNKLDLPDLIKALALVAFGIWLVSKAYKHRQRLLEFFTKNVREAKVWGLSINLSDPPEASLPPGLSVKPVIPMILQAMDKWHAEMVNESPVSKEETDLLFHSLDRSQQAELIKPFLLLTAQYVATLAGMSAVRFSGIAEVHVPFLEGLTKTPTFTYMASLKTDHGVTLISLALPPDDPDLAMQICGAVIVESVAIPQLLAAKDEKWTVIVGLVGKNKVALDELAGYFQEQMAPAIESGKLRIIPALVGDEIAYRGVEAAMRISGLRSTIQPAAPESPTQ